MRDSAGTKLSFESHSAVDAARIRPPSVRMNNSAYCADAVFASNSTARCQALLPRSTFGQGAAGDAQHVFVGGMHRAVDRGEARQGLGHLAAHREAVLPRLLQQALVLGDERGLAAALSEVVRAEPGMESNAGLSPIHRAIRARISCTAPSCTPSCRERCAPR